MAIIVTYDRYVIVCDSVIIICNIIPHLLFKFKIKKSKIKLKNKIKENKIKPSLLSTILTSPPL